MGGLPDALLERMMDRKLVRIGGNSQAREEERGARPVAGLSVSQCNPTSCYLAAALNWRWTHSCTGLLCCSSSLCASLCLADSL